MYSAPDGRAVPFGYVAAQPTQRAGRAPEARAAAVHITSYRRAVASSGGLATNVPCSRTAKLRYRLSSPLHRLRPTSGCSSRVSMRWFNANAPTRLVIPMIANEAGMRWLTPGPTRQPPSFTNRACRTIRSSTMVIKGRGDHEHDEPASETIARHLVPRCRAH
jgi:hypothetical protein